MPDAISYLRCAPAADNLAGTWAASVSDNHASEFEQRLQECHRVVYRVAFGVLRDPADAEEVTQDAFLRAYQKFSSLREPQKFRSWVARTSFRLALNRRRATARDRIRNAAWLETTAGCTGNVETAALEHEFQLRLEQEIDRLPKKLRSVLLLSAVEELKSHEIGEILGIPEGTVRSRLHLARKELLRVFCDDSL